MLANINSYRVMSDSSICVDCPEAEATVLDDSAVAVVGRADEVGRDGRDPPAPAGAGGGDDAEGRPPRDHADDDEGEGDELPRLAHLVAAAVRDRVVLEQMEEIRMLRAELAASHRVEVTGPNGAPVYARGAFSDGDFNALSLRGLDDGGAHRGGRPSAADYADADGAGLYWDVGLDAVDGTPVPLERLADAEVRVGGVLYAAAAEVEATAVAFGIRPGNRFDLARVPDMGRSAVAALNADDGDGGAVGGGAGGGRAALLTFHLPDFPARHWRSLRSVAMLNRSIALRQREREERREERRERRRAERSELIEMGEMDPDDDEDDEDSDDDEEYDGEEDQEPLDVYHYLTLCLSKRHPGQRANVTSVSLCVRSVRGRIEGLSGGEEFLRDRERVFKKIDDMHREELERRADSREGALADIE